jgi:peptidyl-prolyl cis-trans isomerase D
MVMRQLRENTKWIMLCTALAFVGLMVFQWGMDLSGRSGTQASGGEVGRVNGQGISVEEYQTVYRNLYEQQAAGGQNITSALNKQIEQAAWDQIVTQRLIAQELRRRGIRVTDAEIRQAARYAPPPEFQGHELFQTDGRFDITKYHAFLSSPAVDTELLMQLEAFYRDAIPRSKLFYQSTAGLYVNDNELWRMWQDQNDKVRIRFVPFDPATMVADATITVSDSEIRDYYQEHESDFLRPAQASVRYIVLDRSPTAADSATSLARARQLRSEIAAGSFEAVFGREVTDSVAAAGGGKVTLAKGQTYPAIEQAVFSLKPGALTEPILTPAGYYIVRVDSISGDNAQIRQLLVPVQRNEAREDELFDKADSLEVLAETKRLDEVARPFGLEVRTAELIPGLAFVPGLGMADEGMDWAFEEGQVGEVSPVFETPNAYYAFELTDRQEERTLTLAEATPTIRTALTAQKKVERAKETVRQALDQIKSGRSMEEVAAANKTKVQEAGPFARGEYVEGVGRINPAIGTAFGLKTGQLSGVVEADGRLYIIQLLERQDANRADWEQQKDAQRLRVTEALAQQRWGEFMTALREGAEIVDSRAELARAAAAQQQVPPINY